jgi:TonB family protein
LRRSGAQRQRITAVVLACALGTASGAPAKTRPAVRTKYIEAVYPEAFSQTQEQGNVFLIARLDKQGRVSDLHLVAATRKEFIAPAVEAVRGWQFEPALQDGRPVELALNVGVRFRVKGEKRGLIPAPILGDLAISPADESGRRTAPEGFPLRKGYDKALRAEALLDVPPNIQTRTLAVRVEAKSPSGKRIAIFQPPVSVPASATEVKIPVVAKIGPDWEEGVWMLRFTVDGAGAGAGQFWLASDPARFSFVIPKS